MSSVKRKRIDLVLVDKGLTPSRERARSLIMAGKVFVDMQCVDKPGTLVHPLSDITVKEDLPFVSRGGLKLQHAIDRLQLNIKGLVCLDVGASTGGFTDCLLQYGADHVFSVDVGYGQLSWQLRQDKRVTVIERTNIRHMPEDALPCRVDLVTIDVSFISLKIVVPAVLKFIKEKGMILALIKPQFEVGKGKVGKGGVVKDPEQHDAVISDLRTFFTAAEVFCGPVIPSPVLGPKGNKEFVFYMETGR